MRREEACRRQANKPKETPEDTREFLKREEACRRQAYNPKETPEETREFLRREEASEGRPTIQKRIQKRLESF